MLKTNGWSGMEQFGISALTGEACGYGLRLLCDVNDDGKRLLQGFFGVEMKFAQSWNCSVNGKDATGSIMLPRDLYSLLGRYAMFDAGCMYVLESTGGHNQLQGYTEEEAAKYDLHAQREISDCQVWVNHASRDASVCVAGRNVHQMTKRTV